MHPLILRLNWAICLYFTYAVVTCTPYLEVKFCIWKHHNHTSDAVHTVSDVPALLHAWRHQFLLWIKSKLRISPIQQVSSTSLIRSVRCLDILWLMLKVQIIQIWCKYLRRYTFFVIIKAGVPPQVTRELVLSASLKKLFTSMTAWRRSPTLLHLVSASMQELTSA